MPLEKHDLVVGPFQCNCSILVHPVTKEALVIDAGDEFQKIKARCEKLGVKIKYSIHTHGHLDHIGAVKELKTWAPQAKICLHKDDEWIYQNLPMQGQMFGIQYEVPPSVDQFLNDGEELVLGDVKFQMVHTPGHSPGGLCIRVKEGEIGKVPAVFTGDTLFQESIGRTDLWGGDHGLLIKSIKQRLLVLDGETKVFPGHGPSTTIEVEKKSNPFL